MAAIRSRGNESTEVRLARLLRKIGITGWRRHLHLIGRPDFSFPRERIAVFVDGCFWHGCPEHFTQPKSSKTFWVKKIALNKIRDAKVSRELRRQGWTVVRIWEHALTKRESAKSLRRLVRILRRRRVLKGSGVVATMGRSDAHAPAKSSSKSFGSLRGESGRAAIGLPQRSGRRRLRRTL